MKRFIVFSLLFFSLFIGRSAMMTIRWIPTPGLTIGGISPDYLKIYYGGQEGVYTNSAITSLTNRISTTYHGYDPFNCVNVDLIDYVQIDIHGLRLGQQVYYAYSIVNSNGVESPLINQAVCGFVITNNSDSVVLAPLNFHVK